MVDQYGRTIDYMRISITDRCNLRCIYCMPEEGIECIPHNEILTYEEILRLVHAAAANGISKIKITGGEPLVRKNAAELIRQIKQVEGIREVTLTTNGVLFTEQGAALIAAGLDSVNFSLDTQDASNFNRITRVDAYRQVLASVEYALQLGIKTKINCVPLQPYDYADLTELAGFARKYPIDVRFIELMPIGLGLQYEPVKSEFVLGQLTREYGEPKVSPVIHGNGPARYYDFPGFKGSIGFISPISNIFCENCNRIRLTASGTLKLCLCNNRSLELKPLLRGGISDEQLSEVIRNAIYDKPLEHHLGGPDDDTTETKKMVQIGG